MHGLTPATAQIHSLHFIALANPPHCPDLALFNFHLFPTSQRTSLLVRECVVKTAMMMRFKQNAVPMQQTHETTT